MNKTLGMQRPVSSVQRSSYLTEFWLDEKSATNAPASESRSVLAGRKQVGQRTNGRTQPTQCWYSTSCLVNLRSLSSRWIKWCWTAQHGINIWYILNHLEVTFIFAVTRICGKKQKPQFTGDAATVKPVLLWHHRWTSTPDVTPFIRSTLSCWPF